MAADRYSRISRRMWRDEKFMGLSGPKPNARDLWIFLLTGPHCTSIPGLFVLGEASMAEEMGWPVAGTRAALEEIERAGMIRYDRVHRVVWMPNAFRHNVPNNQNQVTGWRQPWSEIPDCAIKREARARLEHFLSDEVAFSDEFRDGFKRAMGELPPKKSTNPSGKSGSAPKGPANVRPTVTEQSTEPLGQPSPNGRPTQDLEQDLEQDSPPPTPASPPAADTAPPAAPDPEVVVKPPTPKPKAIAPLAEVPADALELLAALSANGSRFDWRASTPAEQVEFVRRLREYPLTPAILEEMTMRMRDPEKLWPDAHSVPKHGIRISWVLGRITEGGGRSATFLSSWYFAAADAVTKRLNAQQRRPQQAPVARVVQTEEDRAQYLALRESTLAALGGGR